MALLFKAEAKKLNFVCDSEVILINCYFSKLKEYMYLKGGVLAVILLCNTFLTFSQIPIGNWREHLPYQKATMIAATSQKIFCATPYALFSVDFRENNIERLSKMNGLNEVGISCIGYDDVADKLVVGYLNSNIDILSKNKIYNINSLKAKDIAGDKSIYNIFCDNNKAYLCTGFGIVVVDENKFEIKDTYLIGDSGNLARVNGFVSSSNTLYAATEEGLKTAASDNVNLADYRNWKKLSGTNGLPAGSCQQVLKVQDKIIAQKEDSIFILNGDTWSLLFKSNYKIIRSSSSSGKLILTQRQQGFDSRIVILNTDGSIFKVLIESGKIINPQQALITGDNSWVADFETGLLKISASSITQYQPNSPLSVATGEMIVQNGLLSVASGSVSSTWGNTFTTNGLFQFKDNEWNNFNRTVYPVFDSLYDLVTVVVDPMTNTTWTGSFGGGLLQMKSDHSLKLYYKNSVLQPSLADPDRYRVSGLAFDSDRNLWISNYGAAQNVAVLKSDNTWKNFNVPFATTDNAVAQIVIDDYNQKWIVSPNGNGLFCFNHGLTIDNPGDDRWKYFRSGVGNGNLPDNNVYCVAKDKNSFIWIGTAKGIGIIQCAQDVFSVKGCEAILPIVQQDNFAGYLFRDEQVQTIAVDGADRKWIGTKNGVWLISSDGDKTIYHFKQDNSPLLNNDVNKIAIDDKTGEVFFSTAQGICSYRSTATEGGSTNDNVIVFPNPVPPGYNGSIAIKGLVNNAIVKITELDGRLIYQTRSNGGQATWNGLDYRGRKISTGVYLVLISDDSRKEKMVTKIVFIGK